MSTHAPRSRAILDRLRDPLWLPVLCAAAAFLAWQAASLASSREVLVPLRTLAAGTPITPGLVHAERWSGQLPSAPLQATSGTLVSTAPAGLPLLQNEVGRGAVRPVALARPLVAIPGPSLLSAPPAAPGTPVSIYAAAQGSMPQLICPDAAVASGTTSQTLVLAVPPASLTGVLDALGAERLIVVAHPN